MSYRYLSAGRDGRGWQIRFCWSTRKDPQGYFRGWREVAQPKSARQPGKIKRTLQSRSRHKRLMKELALRRVTAIEGERLAR